MRARNCATWTQVFVRKASNQKTEHQQRSTHNAITVGSPNFNPLARCPSTCVGRVSAVEAVLPYRRIVIESLETAEQTSVGGLGHLPQCGKVSMLRPISKSPRIIHRGFGGASGGLA